MHVLCLLAGACKQELCVDVLHVHVHVHVHYRGKKHQNSLHTCRGNVHDMHVAEAQGSVKEILRYREENSYTFQDNIGKFCICDKCT